MPSKATNRVLTDHEEIRKWAEERGGEPAHVKRTGGDGEIGVLRLDFPGYSGEGTLEHISWDDFFDKFDENGLALLVQDETAGGERSNFNKLVSRETAQNIDQKRSGRGRARGRAAGQSRTVGRTSTAAPKKKAKKATRASGQTRSATRSAGRTRSARTSSSISSQKKAGRSAKSTARAKKSTAQSSRRANTKTKSKSSTTRGTSGSRKVITMRTSKSASPASRKSNRGQSGRRRAA